MSGTNVVLLRSTDAGAPVLSGTAGSLITLLDACLINGYNNKAVATVTRNGSTATFAFGSAHGFAADGLTKVRTLGADQPEYNGDFKIFNVTTLSFDVTVTGTPVTPATGTITAKVAPLDWGKTFAGTNKAVYRSSEATSTQMYLRIDDNNPNLDTGKSANARGYEAMTDVDTGTGLFPTTAQMTNGVFINKSNASDSTARPWVLVGDGFEFHLFYVCNSTTYPGIYRQFHFGDPAPEMASDPYGCLIYGDTAAYTGTADFNQTTHLIVTAATGGIQAGHYFARLYSQTGAAIPAGKNGNVAMGSATIGVGNMAYPAPHNNGLYLSPLFVQDITVLRSQLKGAWQPLHTRPLGHGGTVSAANSPIGRRLYAVATAYSSGTAGETHIDIDGPWR